MVNILIEALDGERITPRTGKHLVKGRIKELPLGHRPYLMVIYDESEGCESPGVFVAVNDLQIVGSGYKFEDDAGRQFKITILE